MASKPQHKWSAALWPLAVSLSGRASGTVLSRGEVSEGCVGGLSWVSLTAFGAEGSDPRHAVVVPAVILLS